MNVESTRQLADENEMEKMEELAAALRVKLNSTEKDFEKVSQENLQLSEAFEKLQRQDDIDRLALQHELNESKRKTAESKKKADDAEESKRILEVTHAQTLKALEALGEQLKAERSKNAALEHQISQNSLSKQTESELLVMIEDLQTEKKLLENEIARLGANRFAVQRDEEFRKDVERLAKVVQDLEAKLAQQMQEKAALHAQIRELTEKLESMDLKGRDSESSRYTLQHEIDELRAKLALFGKDGDIDMAELEEALAMLRLKRERGFSVDYLLSIEHLTEDNKSLQDLRKKYAECAHELEKTLKLLKVQEQINRDYKLEVEQYHLKLQAIQNEYELRLEENARLLDIRGGKIATLESQLQNLVYGAAKVPPKLLTSVEFEDDTELRTGQNRLEFHFEGAHISQEGFAYIQRTYPGLEGPNSLTTFVYMDFFEFETEPSVLGLGLKPLYNHTSRYTTYIDDFFLSYLQTSSVVLHLCRANGVEFTRLGSCNVNVADLLKDDSTKPKKLYANIMADNGKVVLGKLDYSVHIRIPMTMAIKAFKERVFALNLLKAHGGTDNSVPAFDPKFGSRAKTNNLTFKVDKAMLFKKGPSEGPPKIFGVVSCGPFKHELVIPPCPGTYSPVFNFMTVIPLAMTADLDRYLRSSKLSLFFIDDGAQDVFYGCAKIGLADLATNKGIHGDFEVTHASGVGCGIVTVHLEWDLPYSLSDHVPVVSLIDDKPVAQEIIGSQTSTEKPVEAKVETPIQREGEIVVETIQRVEPPLPQKEATKPGPPLKQVSTDTGSSFSVSSESVTSLMDKISAPSTNVPSTRVSVAKPQSTNAREQVLDVLRSLPVTPAVEIPSSPDVMDGFKLSIQSVKLALTVPAVKALLSATRQVFVSYDFLKFSLEHLETHSARLTPSGSLAFEYHHLFSVADLAAPENLAELKVLKSSGRASIVFTIVDEPPDEPASSSTDVSTAPSECVDIATARLDLESLFNENVYGSKTPIEVKIPLFSMRGEVEMGTLGLSLQGVGALSQLYKSI